MSMHTIRYAFIWPKVIPVIIEFSRLSLTSLFENECAFNVRLKKPNKRPAFPISVISDISDERWRHLSFSSDQLSNPLKGCVFCASCAAWKSPGLINKNTPTLPSDWTSRFYALIITVLGFPTASEYEIIGEAKKRSTGRGKARRNFTPPNKKVFSSKATGCWGQVSWKLHPGLLRTSKTYNRVGLGEPDAEKKALVISSRCRCRM